MAAFGAFQFASPAQYGDWAQYAGFNRTTGEIEDSRLTQGLKAAAGIKPPENMQQYIQQRLEPAQNRMAAVVPAMQQMSQGNVVQGIGTFRAGQPVATPTAPQPQVFDHEYDYTPRF
jgi:hypothetical protein